MAVFSRALPVAGEAKAKKAQRSKFVLRQQQTNFVNRKSPACRSC